MKRTVYEYCPHCEDEIEMEWDVENDGYQTVCPNCGKTLMLCDECLHGEGSCGQCDFNRKTGRCRHSQKTEK